MPRTKNEQTPVRSPRLILSLYQHALYIRPGGRFDPWNHGQEDGQAVMERMCKQPWCIGSFAMLGGSNFGFVQWVSLWNPPHDAGAATIHCTRYDLSWLSWGTGSLGLGWITWAETVAHQEESGSFTTQRFFDTQEYVARVGSSAAVRERDVLLLRP